MYTNFSKIVVNNVCIEVFFKGYISFFGLILFVFYEYLGVFGF